MFDHVTIRVSDLDVSRSFSEHALSTLGFDINKKRIADYPALSRYVEMLFDRTGGP